MNLVVLVPYVSKSLPIATYPALQLLLLSQLQEVICLRSDVVPFSYLSTTLKTEIGLLPNREPKLQIPLQRVKGKIPILYSSAIALQLAKPCQQTPLALAAAIAEQFASVAIAQDLPKFSGWESYDQIVRNFTVKAEPSGWLYFELASSGLAAWLQWLTQLDELLAQPERHAMHSRFAATETSANASVVPRSHVFDAFAVQYAHARCCSLLRLADTQNQVAGSLSNTKEGNLPDLSLPDAIAPSIPWLNAQGELRFSHAAEQHLIFALIDTVDELGSLMGAAIAPSPTLEWQFWQFKVEKLAAALAQAFLHFYDACRFWGEVRQQDPDLVQARLGLVLATQLLLQFMLRECLGLNAPTEL